MDNEMFERALSCLRAGGTLLYPTDTVWGIGCDAANDAAIERIYSIKQRDHNKAMLVLATPQMLSSHLPEEIGKLLLQSERPTTVIMPTDLFVRPVASNLPASDGTLGVRIPRHDFCQLLLRQFDGLIVSTSANFSGMPAPMTFGDIDPELMHCIDYHLPDIPEFSHPQTPPSQIVKIEPDGSLSKIRG